MEKFKGTPGPWFSLPAEQPVSQYSHVINSNAGCVGYWKGHNDWHKDSNWVLTKDDANLIATAPDLLEELQRAAEVYDALLSDGYMAYKDDAIRTNSVIARALGKNDGAE